MMDELLTRIIFIYGMENDVTIEFARLIDQGWPYDLLLKLVELHEQLQQEDDED